MKTFTKATLFFFLICSVQSQCQILFSETFNSNLGGTNASNGTNGNWIWSNSCSMSGAGGHSAPGHALFQGSGCQFGNGGSTVSGNLNTPTIAIGPSGAVLTFNYYLFTECGSGTCPYDVLTFQISNNGGVSYTDIMASTGFPPGLQHTNAWTPVSYTLNAYSNQTIIIRFNFNSIDGIGNAYDGVYVDDIIVTGNCFINLGTSPGNNTVSPMICAGNSLTLTTNAVSNFSWSTGATTSSIVVAPTTNTMYSIVATSSANCSSSASMNVSVNGGVPVLNVANTASANSGTCPNSTVVLTASGATTYTWTGPGPVTNGVPFAPTSSGSYTVTGTNACGNTTAALSISVHPSPTLTAIASQPTVCSGVPITITGVGNAASYLVNGNLPNGSSIFPSVTQNHTVVGTSSLGCTASAVVPVTVVTTPLAPPIASPPLICIGNSALLSSTGASNYSWIGQSGPFSSASSVTVAPTSTTTYTLTKSNANCVNTQTVRVIVNPLPGVFAFVNPTIVCEGKPANLSAGGAASYTWTAPPSFSVVGSSPIVTPTISTMYTVTASDGTCVNQTTVFLPTNPNPTIGIVATSSTICREQTVSITASGALSYTWTAIGLASNSTAVTITESPTLSTLYSVIGENTFNCTSGNSQVVVVYPNPTLTISSNKPMVCVGAPANLTVTGANTYTWDNNAGGATTPVVIVNPQVTTVYTVAGTYSATGCTTVKTIPIIVFQPTFAVNSPTSSCLGGTINLIASGAQSYTWNGNAPFSQISVSPPTATVYQVAATSVSVGVTCVSTNSVLVSIYANPTVMAVPQRTLICKGETTNLVGTGAVDYQWSTGQTGSLVPANPISNTNYTVLGTDQNGCIGTTSLSLKVSPCFGIDEVGNNYDLGLLLYPNPNSGNFTISTQKDLNFTIINELGQTVMTGALVDSNNRKIQIANLHPGIYFISGQNSGEKVHAKIVISK